MSTSTGTPTHFSSQYLATRAACQEVPQATRAMRSIRRMAASSRPISGSSTRPVSGTMRPLTVLRIACGCSKISLSMKWRKPAFSAMAALQSMVVTALSRSAPSSTLRIVYVPRPSTTISRSSRKITSRVKGKRAGMSEATRQASAVTPMTSGLWLRAATS